MPEAMTVRQLGPWPWWTRLRFRGMNVPGIPTPAQGAGASIRFSGTSRRKLTMALTSALGQFIADLSPNRVPDEAVHIARMGFIDCIGTMIVGRSEPCTQILKGVVAPGSGAATLYFSGEAS